MDLAFVELHTLPQRPIVVTAVEGEAWLVVDSSHRKPMEVGGSVKIGDVVFVGPGARVQLELTTLEGGAEGMAHSFVDRTAVENSPGRKDVPRLIRDLTQIENKMLQHLGEDPLATHAPLTTPYERSYASDFALQNLDLHVATLLPESVAREVGAVFLFLAGDAACVAMTQVSVSNMRRLMEALGRPVNPHVVDEETIRALLVGVYGALAGGAVS